MSALSVTNFNSSRFALTGFPGLEIYYLWLSVPFSVIYVTVFLGNCMVLHVIRTEPSLHQPMFYFLAMLALTDLCMGLSTVHTVLGILWGFIQEISLDACIAQSYFIHGLSFMESSVLLAMSFDRYIAICNPLRYASILTNDRIMKIMILHTVLSIASREERIKSLQTCVSHISAVLVFYIPIIGLTMVHRFGKHLSPLVHVLMGNVYILFPPLMNPIIYSIKTQQIRVRIQRLFLKGT
nr:LOW QUALITY PROTEIN: olfactory receptor 51V1-like [Meriones unguiculatus]